MENFIEGKINEKETFRITGYRVLVRPEKVADFYGQTRLIVPDTYKRWATKGTIIGIGEAVDRNLCLFKIGDNVFYGTGLKGVDISIDGEQAKILSPDDIEAIIR
jgi:co-chaperonin GroES (HSP10)